MSPAKIIVKPYFICLSILGFLFLHITTLQAQCTEEKDPEMAKYMKLTKTQDAQGCSQCGMLALYFCSARYCVKPEDKRKVSAMITACKRNVVDMGQPYCCPDYVNKEPQWGVMAGGSTSNSGNSNSGNNTGQSNPMGDYNPSEASSNPMGNYNPAAGSTNPMQSNTKTYRTGDADIDNTMDLVNASLDIANQLNGGSSTGAGYSSSQSYRTGEADIDNTMDLVNTSLNIANQLTGGTGTGVSYGGTPSYSTGDAGIDNVVGAATGLLDILGGGTGSVGSYSPTSGYGALFGVLGNAANEVNEQDRINQEAAAKRQREAAIRAAEYERVQKEKQQLAAARKSLLARYPDGQVPASYPGIRATEVYFFVYRSSESSNTSSASANNSVASNSATIGVADLQKGKYYLIQAYDILAKYYIKFNNRYSADDIDGAYRVPTVGQPWYPNGRFTKVKVIKEVSEQEAKETIDNNYSIAGLFSAAQTNSSAAKASQTVTPEISISNVFTVSKFSDGTWPLKSKVIEKLDLKGATTDITLSGYYTSKTDAESSQRYLFSKARECAFSVSTINCSAGESAKIAAPGTDFWGNPIDKANSSSVNTTPVKETISNKPKLDFWGNPIKD